MKTFTDAAGRTWTLTLNLGTAMAVKAKLDIDLLQPEAGDPPLLTRLGTDEMLLGEVLCAMLEGQFVTHKVTEDDVRSGFDGQTLLAAQKAFYEELIDFFRSRGRNDRAKAVAKQMAIIDAAVTAIETRIDNIDVDQTIRGAMSGESPDQSASAPSTSEG
ncbi:hypothetical protein HED60_23610 [Planctomycetales bacterium ZRK34]|nr:hypothetical protein HED60_23610 [Planctomycetales bacterium ZRK34]